MKVDIRTTKFQIGDRVEWVGGRYRGTVLQVREKELLVTWDHTPKPPRWNYRDGHRLLHNGLSYLKRRHNL